VVKLVKLIVIAHEQDLPVGHRERLLTELPVFRPQNRHFKIGFPFQLHKLVLLAQCRPCEHHLGQRVLKVAVDLLWQGTLVNSLLELLAKEDSDVLRAQRRDQQVQSQEVSRLQTWVHLYTLCRLLEFS
jgi:hypothetical protein